MVFISALSITGFFGYLVLDLPQLRRRPGLRAMLTLVSSIILLSVLVLAALDPVPLMSTAIHRWAAWCGLILLLAGALLLAYSLFIEIPRALARATSCTHAPPDAASQLAPSESSCGVEWLATNGIVSSGTYALCRHPGVLWLGVFLLGYLLVANSLEALCTAVVWLLLDIAVVAIQDFVVFPRVLAGYAVYRRRTPFIIPNRASLSAALKSYRGSPCTSLNRKQAT